MLGGSVDDIARADELIRVRLHDADKGGGRLHDASVPARGGGHRALP
jgi:hypothetical protein